MDDTANARRAVIGRWKEQRGCKTCGNKSLKSFQLDLDHRDPKLKSFGIARRDKLAGQSWSTIKKEISKCDILCKNCHALKTHS